MSARVAGLAVTGELTIQTAAERRAALVALLEGAERSGATEIDVDLSGVTELDTAGLQVLLVAQREAAHLGRRLRLVEVSRAVTDVLAIVQLTTELTGAPAAQLEESHR